MGVTNGKLDKKTPELGSLCSWLQPQDLNISIAKMILSLFFFCICGIVTSSPVTEEEESSAIKFPAATTSSSQNQQWCDFRCTNVGTLSAQSVNLNGIPSTCSNGFCRATDGK